MLVDVVALKKLAVDYVHHELGFVSTNPTTYSRNYFSRTTSLAQEDIDDAREKDQILVDAVILKKLAISYARPDLGVVNTDLATLIRN